MLATLLALAATGCVPAAKGPLSVTTLRAAGSDTLVILLPGRFDDADDFRKRRFAEIAREEGATFDLAAADAHVGYYAGGAVAERLEDDVVVPARRAGYRRIWLAGISMGGLGALMVLERDPRGVDGVLLMAPYLGETETAQEVHAAGGLAAWSPPDVPREAMDFSTRIWAAAHEAVLSGTPIFLAYGTEDDLAPQHEVLAEALPADRVHSAPGGHEWEPWLDGWRWFAQLFARTTPQATRPPAFPVGCVVKSSAAAWTMTERPTTSVSGAPPIVQSSVDKVSDAFPSSAATRFPMSPRW